jgi:hypothetical protein
MLAQPIVDHLNRSGAVVVPIDDRDPVESVSHLPRRLPDAGL